MEIDNFINTLYKLGLFPRYDDLDLIEYIMKLEDKLYSEWH